MVLTKFMRLSLMKAAHVVVSSAAYRKIRVARIPVGPDGVEEVHAAFLNETAHAVLSSAAYRKSGSRASPWLVMSITDAKLFLRDPHSREVRALGMRHVD
jgi:hypothetical protein